MIKVDGQWHEVSWDAAFRRCTELLAPVTKEHGIGAVTCYTGNRSRIRSRSAATPVCCSACIR
jgi:predicted molibdopterin-dependent oxidoreductase YjgC